MSETFLQMKHITKRFPGVLALNDVQFSLRRGEVHALLGENGAGKSTLMKILSGVYQPDEGEIIFEDKPVSFSDPLSAQNVGTVSYTHLTLPTTRHQCRSRWSPYH